MRLTAGIAAILALLFHVLAPRHWMMAFHMVPTSSFKRATHIQTSILLSILA